MEIVEFRRLCMEVFRDFQKTVPNPRTRYKKYYTNAYGNRQRGSTGNMAFNAARMRFNGADICRIYIDDRIAPYLPYTIKPWISPRWKGHKNPNEGWFGRSARIIAENVAHKTNGVMSKRRNKK